MVQKEKLTLVFLIQHHPQHEHMRTSEKTDSTKWLKTLIRYHDVDVKSRKNIWLLMVGCSSLASAMWHDALLHIKNYESETQFLVAKIKIRFSFYTCNRHRTIFPKVWFGHSASPFWLGAPAAVGSNR